MDAHFWRLLTRQTTAGCRTPVRLKRPPSVTHYISVAHQAPLRNLIWFAYGDIKSAVQTGSMRVW